MGGVMSDSLGAAAMRTSNNAEAAAKNGVDNAEQKNDRTNSSPLQNYALPDLLKLKPELKPVDWLPPLPLNEQLNRQAMELAKQKNENQAKPEVIDGAARDQVIAQMKNDERKQLDRMRMELAVTTGTQEREKKAAEISAFLTEKLGDKVSDSGRKALLNPEKLGNLLSEVKSKRPAETAALHQAIKETLLKNAENAIPDAKKREEFAQKMEAFEKRAAARNMPESEVLGTLLQIGRVLDPNNNLEHGNKSVLARSMMSNAADNTNIDQGGHNTCNVTAMQCRLYAQEPSIPSRVIADIAVGGKFVTADGTIVKPMNLDPDDEAKHDPPPDGARNYASQLFQLAAINAYWNRQDTMPGGKTVGKGNIQYAQTKEGECLLDVSVDPPQRVKFNTIDAGQPWLDIFRISEICAQLSGKPPENFGIKRWFLSRETEGVSEVVTLSGFKERLSKYKEQNAFPVLVEVDAAKPPFGDGKGYGPHVVTITDYDPQTGLVSVDNQWGKWADLTDLPGQGKRPTAELMFSSMNPIPPVNFMWDKVTGGLKDLKWSDAIEPSKAALSTKALGWGLSASAPWAVRGGLSYMSKWGVPGAESVLAASETKLGGATLRVGTSVAALGAYAYINNLPGAFKQGTSAGMGKLTHVAGDWASFELGRTLTSKVVSFVPWAPARIGLSLAAGAATSTVFDHLAGEGSEIAGSWLYDRAREYWKPGPRLTPHDKPIVPAPVQPLKEPVVNHGAISNLGKSTMIEYFNQRRSDNMQTNDLPYKAP